MDARGDRHSRTSTCRSGHIRKVRRRSISASIPTDIFRAWRMTASSSGSLTRSTCISPDTYAGAPLWPAGANDHALVYQRSLWQRPCIVSIAKGLSKGAPDPRAVALELDQPCAALGILEDRLVGPYLLGDDFTDPSRARRRRHLWNRRDGSGPFPKCRALARSLQCAACKSSRSLDEGLDEHQPLETGFAKRHNESGRTCGRSLYKADASLASCPPPMTP